MNASELVVALEKSRKLLEEYIAQNKTNISDGWMPLDVVSIVLEVKALGLLLPPRVDGGAAACPKCGYKFTIV